MLGYEDAVISFSFAALDYRVPEKNRYAFKVEGVIEEWINLGAKHDITLTNLLPGTYVLRVRGSNNDGVWNEAGVSFRFHVAGEPWQTWLLVRLGGLFVLFLLCLLVYVVYRRRT